MGVVKKREAGYSAVKTTPFNSKCKINKANTPKHLIFDIIKTQDDFSESVELEV